MFVFPEPVLHRSTTGLQQCHLSHCTIVVVVVVVVGLMENDSGSVPADTARENFEVRQEEDDDF